MANNISKILFVYNLKLNYLSNIKFMGAEEMGEQDKTIGDDFLSAFVTSRITTKI